MDAILRPGAPEVWTVLTPGGEMLGALEQRPEGYVVVASVNTPLADVDVPPFLSLESAMAGIGAHLGGDRTLARDACVPPRPCCTIFALPWRRCRSSTRISIDEAETVHYVTVTREVRVPADVAACPSMRRSGRRARR